MAALQAGEINGVDCSGIYLDVSNITKSEHIALENHRKDKDCIIVTADKGVVWVVMIKQNTSQNVILPTNNSVYQYLSKDTSPTIYKELIKILQDYKNYNFISETEYTQLRPHGSASRFYGLPKIHKNNVPMCPIASVCGTATYNTAKFISKILQNYCDKTSSFVKDSTDFIKKIKHLSINPEEETLVSFEVSALITSISDLLHYKLPIPNFYLHQFHQCLPRSLQKNSSSFWNSLSQTASSASTRNFK